jgi:hypothetical protein
MELNMTEIILALIQKYGIVTVALGFCYWNIKVSGKQVDDKLNRLISLQHQTFGAMLSIVDSDKRNQIVSNTKGDFDA